MRTLLLLVLSLGLALTGAHGATLDDDPSPAPRCTKCKQVGKRECKDCKHKHSELEDGVVYCSWKDDCETCLGAGYVDCGDCENEVAEDWLQERRRAQEDLKAKHDEEIDAELEREVLKCETDHFVLVWDVEKWKIGKKLQSDHEAMHVYAERLEALFADYLEVFDAGEADFRLKSLVMVWGLEVDQRKASLRLLDNESANGMKLMGSTPKYTLHCRQQGIRDDEDLHRNLTHSVAHLLLSHHTPSEWIGNKKGGWADAGVAHLFEYRLDGLCTNYCYQEQNTNRDFKGGKWKPAIRKMVAQDDQPPVATVFAQNTDTLTLEQHAVAFSYVDYLTTLDGAEANRLFRMLRGKTPTRDALRSVYGQSPFEFEEAWKAWVLEMYPRR